MKLSCNWYVTGKVPNYNLIYVKDFEFKYQIYADDYCRLFTSGYGFIDKHKLKYL